LTTNCCSSGIKRQTGLANEISLPKSDNIEKKTKIDDKKVQQLRQCSIFGQMVLLPSGLFFSLGSVYSP
jgi:hypothetical protein